MNSGRARNDRLPSFQTGAPILVLHSFNACRSTATKMVSTRLSVLLITLFSLCACATHRHKQAMDAATTPLTDLNLIREKIPDALKSAQQAPYAIPADESCDSLTSEIATLDDALGPDLDTPATTENPGLIERATDLVSDQAVSAIRRTAQGVVPFREWVRKLSGAERHSKLVDSAIAAGIVRRAFLKGLKVSKQCKSAPPSKNDSASPP